MAFVTADKKPVRAISRSDIAADLAKQDVTAYTDDPDILASFDPQNPIPISNIVLLDAEKNLTYEERLELRKRR